MIISHAQIAIRMAADFAGVTPEQFCCRGRVRLLAYPRFAVMRALYRMGWNTCAIGEALGGRDHTTILHGLKRFGSMPDDIYDLADRIEETLRKDYAEFDDTPAFPTDFLVAA